MCVFDGTISFLAEKETKVLEAVDEKGSDMMSDLDDCYVGGYYDVHYSLFSVLLFQRCLPLTGIPCLPTCSCQRVCSVFY